MRKRVGPTQGAKEGTTGYLLGDLEGVANVRGVKHLVVESAHTA